MLFGGLKKPQDAFSSGTSLEYSLTLLHRYLFRQIPCSFLNGRSPYHILKPCEGSVMVCIRTRLGIHRTPLSSTP